MWVNADTLNWVTNHEISFLVDLNRFYAIGLGPR